MIERLRQKVLGAVEAVESMQVSLGRWLMILAAIIIVRHFLEQVSGQLKTFYFVSYFVHYPLAYIAPLLALAITLSLLSRERVERVTKLMLFAWLLTLLPPLLDLLIARTRESPELIGYLLPGPGKLTTAFLNLLNPFHGQLVGATAGIRIEAAIGCILGAIYVHLKTRSLRRSIATFFIVYAVSFFFFALPPLFVTFSRLLGSDVENVYQLFFARANVHRAFANVTPFTLSDLSNSLLDLFVILPLIVIWYRIYDREKLRSAARSIEPVQSLYHVLLTFCGIVVGARLLMGSRGLVSVGHPFDICSLVGILAASFFASLAAQTIGRLQAHDSGDTASPDDAEERRTLGTIYFALASLLALSVSYVALTFVLAFLAVYYLYYARPLRLHRFFPVSSLLIAGASLFSFELGYCAYAGAAAALWTPRSLVALALVVPALALSAKDLWAPRAPEAQGGWNLPRLLGERRARLASGAATFAAALMPAIVLRAPALFVPGAIAGVLAFAVIARMRVRLIPPALLILMAASLVAGLGLGVTGTPVLKSDLSSTTFADATRKEGTFELIEREYATEQQSYLNKGVVLFQQGEFETSVEAFRKALEIDPEYTQAYINIGTAYMRLSRFAEADRSFRKAISLDPENVLAHVGLGQNYKLSGNADAAIEELTTALGLDPENAEAAYTLALVHQDLNDLAKEIEALQLTVSVDPRNSLAHARLGDIYVANGMHENAIAAFRAALLGDTRVEHLHTRLAEAYYMMGDLGRAEEETRKEIRLRPLSASPHANLARILEEQGRTEEAIHEVESALELTADPRFQARLTEELNLLTQRIGSDR